MRSSLAVTADRWAAIIVAVVTIGLLAAMQWLTGGAIN
jgi:hypothetical protein